MNKLLAILLLCPLVAAAADWRYDGQMAAEGASATATSDMASGESSSAMAMPAAGPAPSGAPGNNMTMAKVREVHGEPDGIRDAVGEPPITRWQYPEYVVYFEGDRVITSVSGHW